MQGSVQCVQDIDLRRSQVYLILYTKLPQYYGDYYALKFVAISKSAVCHQLNERKKRRRKFETTLRQDELITADGHV